MADELICPHCGAAVQRPEDFMQNAVTCPACGEEFVIAHELHDGEPDEEAARAEAQAEFDRQRDLNDTRIRALSAERRATYRTRTFLFIAVVVLLAAIYEIVRRIFGRDYGYNAFGKAALAVLLIGCAIGVRFFFRKLVRTQRELNQPMQPEPTEPPDFTALEDGSQTWRQLEEMNKPDDEVGTMNDER